MLKHFLQNCLYFQVTVLLLFFLHNYYLRLSDSKFSCKLNPHQLELAIICQCLYSFIFLITATIIQSLSFKQSFERFFTFFPCLNSLGISDTTFSTWTFFSQMYLMVFQCHTAKYKFFRLAVDSCKSKVHLNLISYYFCSQTSQSDQKPTLEL